MSQPAENGRSLGRIIKGMTIGHNLEQARHRMRNAWVAGFIWAALSFIGAASGVWALAPEAEGGPGLALFIAAMVEVGLVAYLSYGVLQRRPIAATVLFFYFWTSRLPWIAVGLITLQSGPDIARFLVLQALPAYLFFQGMRGAWTYYHLTHPRHPDTPEETGGPGAAPGDDGG